MPQGSYSAGFHFIVGTSDRISNRSNRRAITSHATKTQWKRRKGAKLRSWINPTRNLRLVKGSESPRPPYSPVPSPKLVGGDFSGLQLPPGIEPAMIQDLVKLIDLDSQGVYPYEVCLQVHPVERGWFPYMVSDICCIHSMMFGVRAFVDSPAEDGQTSRMAAFHFAKTLQLLQSRINAFGQGQWSAYYESTIMVIINLASIAELSGDLVTAKNHIDGLLKMIDLRGGVKSLSVHNNMQVKVCRADVGLALRSGTRAQLFREEISWECFIFGRGLVSCDHGRYDIQICAFLDTLDVRLANCWRDVHAFSCLSNLAYQTTRKLPPETYSEMMISALYRLLHLSFDEEDVLQEGIRIGLLTFCSTIFLTRCYLEQPYEHLFGIFSKASFKLSHLPCTIVPPPVMLWLTILYHIVNKTGSSPGHWQSVWFENAILLSGVSTWSDAHTMLRSIMWVDFVHDLPGKKHFVAAVEQLGKVEKS